MPTTDSTTQSFAPAPSAGPSGPTLPAGTILAGRYRVEGLLGRGGMGEVYRAEDLTLRQSVALKCLPRSQGPDPDAMDRLLDEVRAARQVTHPNVCRVHDIVLVEGRAILSMELVGGEDLASLLRRVGRLNQDKGLQIARQIAAALAAVHARGILHRDLKPANVMIDAQGEVRLTDFGLAVSAAGAGEAGLGGTPAYMAPEVLVGGRATVQSDLFALGLVLYEIFTGKRAFGASRLEDLRRQLIEREPASPGSLAPGLDPALEREILRCLAKDPMLRPPSALAVLGALPGGDPLAALLAAGETPSPQVVADAGGSGALSPARAWAWFAALALALPAALWVMGRASVLRYARLPKPPAVLAERAHQVLARAGHPAAVADASHVFYYGHPMKAEAVQDPSPARLQALAQGRPPLIGFRYRVAPAPMQPLNAYAQVLWSDPPPTQAGMATVWLDPQGRLFSYESRLPLAMGEPPGSLDWKALLAEASLDPAGLEPAPPTRFPPGYATALAAWTQGPLRFEGAERNGRLVSFSTQRSKAPGAPPRTPALLRLARETYDLLLSVLLYLLPLGLIYRNWRRGRLDLPGANRLGAFLLAACFLNEMCLAHHLAEIGWEAYVFYRCMMAALASTLMVWLAYLAVEPFVRRQWPDSLIAWSRLLAGRLRDPRVGRDLLVGLAVGWSAVFLLGLAHVLARRPIWPVLAFPESPSATLAQTGAILRSGLSHALGFVVIFFILRLLVRRIWIAVPLQVAVITFVASASIGWAEAGPLDLAVGALWSLGAVALLARYGLLALAAFFLPLASTPFPMGLGLDGWYAAGSLLFPVLTALLGMAALATSVGGQPLLGQPGDD